MIDDARAFNARYPGATTSVFACQYPGQYREAAEALRQVRKESQDERETI